MIKYCNGTRDGILYTGAGSRGAVRDYFAQQSDSLFLPEFEVIGPVTLDKPMAYYGENSPSGAKDIRFSEFCSEALEQATTLVSDFKRGSIMMETALWIWPFSYMPVYRNRIPE